ncbi:hypothetical protein [Paraburkholderia sp.]|uniref:hypothetical protein n=1 Tax=Paraburkholderia sp. TaxID=1926495 RepID=UPI0025E290AB|nr:hypothetical protein [Paraburkholderia sp.]
MLSPREASTSACQWSYPLIQDVEITDYVPIKFHIESLKKTGDADLRLIWRFTLPGCV